MIAHWLRAGVAILFSYLRIHRSMSDMFKKLIESRLFWAALGVLLIILLLPFEIQLLATILLAAWIVGDSIRSTTKAILLSLMLGSLATCAMASDLHDRCREATVRIRNGNSMGSGTVFRESADHFYVLTNAHVAGTDLGNQVSLEFWKDGHQSRPVTGQTVAVAYIPRAYRDIAVVRVAKQTLGSYRPPVIPLAGEQDSVDYRAIFSVGCAAGRWPTAFEGFALRRNTNGGDTIHFVPMPAGGRSGSAIFDVLGEVPKIVGLIAWRSSDDGGHGYDGRGETHGYGIAMTHQEIWSGLLGKRTTGEVLLVPPEGAEPVSTQAVPAPVPDKQPNAIPESGGIVLKYSDSFAVQPDSSRSRLRVPTTGSSDDIMLLYQSEVTPEGPRLEPPPLSAYGQCPPGGDCPPQQQPYGQEQFGQDRGGSGLFPSLPWNREQTEPENRLIPRPRDWLMDRLPIPSFTQVLPWLILIVVLGVLGFRTLASTLSRWVDNAARELRDREVAEPEDPTPPPTPAPRKTTRRTRAR
ncbi:S1 family peptidase [Novipirellula artificiosorum]|uniref:Serine protease n=1 Tax=Novipirellula artificiosorum TaxID=2528016 RepID=A0A5C6DW94_9BACT|nr:serine protease [Novipirellula artificiosorum]TWU39326.1 hypothetical protein Poly41_21500 [Novipirellula artificiosorum]